MIRWSTFMEVVFYIGCLAQAAYLSEPGRRMLGTGGLVYLMLVPYFILFVAQRGRKRVVARAHLVAIAWYLGLTALVVTMSIRGYRPPGWWLYLPLIAPGTAVSVVFLYYRIRDAISG